MQQGKWWRNCAKKEFGKLKYCTSNKNRRALKKSWISIRQELEVCATSVYSHGCYNYSILRLFKMFIPISAYILTFYLGWSQNKAARFGRATLQKTKKNLPRFLRILSHKQCGLSRGEGIDRVRVSAEHLHNQSNKRLMCLGSEKHSVILSCPLK